MNDNVLILMDMKNFMLNSVVGALERITTLYVIPICITRRRKVGGEKKEREAHALRHEKGEKGYIHTYKQVQFT